VPIPPVEALPTDRQATKNHGKSLPVEFRSVLS
jgi:hypothetical protein